MEIESPGLLPPRKFLAVIVNYNTWLSSALAILSTLKHVDADLLVCDCHSSDGSYELFRRLQEKHGFFLTRIPLRNHGDTLDELCRVLQAEYVFFIDSDSEILDPEYMKTMQRNIRLEGVFGAGFVHGPCVLSIDEEKGHYAERPWMPCTLLNLRHIRTALDRGKSFRDGVMHNEFPHIPPLRALFKLRMKIPGIRNMPFRFLKPFRGTYFFSRPVYIYRDTGAEVYEYLKYARGYHFVGLPADLHEPYVKHYHGITRRMINPDVEPATTMKDVSGEIETRLQTVYGFDPHGVET